MASAVLILFITAAGQVGLIAVEMPDRARCGAALTTLLGEHQFVTGGFCLDLMPRVVEALPE